MKRLKNILLLLICALLFLIYFPDEKNYMPVANATLKDWNPKSFWYYPWGRSITHKGIDIFAKKGTNVVARTYGLVIFAGYNGIGGKAVIVLSNKLHLHYYAHLKMINTTKFTFVSAGEKMGEVGSTGNAKGKPAHLHYSISRLIPQPMDWDFNVPQGWKKMFYIDPALNLAAK
ncbi:MAG TPA: M23 family metallopeptidase [Leucothrix mucor]|uniref:M23 family metallopeptidase n=1 Tax=Leucothrix mucor TaxID=45248 RepID=A0A7V2WVD8_LEUMU|nr:M23 family metallopeptidase [Leucothrix mucor]